MGDAVGRRRTSRKRVGSCKVLRTNLNTQEKNGAGSQADQPCRRDAPTPRTIRPSMEAEMRVMKWSSVGAVVFLAAVGVSSLGCADSQAPAQAPTGAAGEQGQLVQGTPEDIDNQDSQDLKSHHRHVHGGFEHFVFLAIETLGVSPEQQAQVDKISADLHAKMQPVRDAQKVVLMTLAEGVAAGNVDAAKVDAEVAGVTAAAGQQHGAAADALNQLHAVLRPEQRVALVDKVEAHWEMWKQANADEKIAAGEHDPGGRFAFLAKEYALTGEQVEKLRTSFPASLSAHAQSHGVFDPGEGDEHMIAFRKAFVADTFDAKSLTEHGAAHAQIASWGMARMARFYEALAPVLTPEQRPKVADKLRMIANKM